MDKIVVSESKDITEIGLTEEEIADGIIRDCGGAKIGLYSERQLARKMRDESTRLSHIAEAEFPTIASAFLFERLVIRVLWESGLSALERKVCGMLLSGYTRSEIARRLGMSKQRVGYLFLRIRAAIEARPRYDPYFGLYEVYWAEVNRYIYRKPRLVWD